MPMESIIKGPAAGVTTANGDEQTLAETGFYWRETEGIKVLVSRALEDAGFINGFSTRLGGVSPFPSGDLNLAGYDEDSTENIDENRRRFLRAFEGNLTLTTVWQVHGDTVKTVGDLRQASETNEKADAIVSNLTGLLAGVKTADCVPVLLGDPVTGSYAAVHAGWRGTAAAIVRKALQTLVQTYGVEPKNVVAAIGPAATCRNYEIGQEVIDAFGKVKGRSKYFVPTREGHALVDLISANLDQLASAGVPRENISVSPFCTMERTDLFFSYRIEKRKYGRTGRLLSVIGRNGR